MSRLALTFAAAWGCLLGAAAAAGTDAEPPRPNVLVILADDLGFSDLGSYGGEIDTPHLDRLAAGGLRFTQGYNTARCWPTRAALLTGYYPQAIQRDSLPGGKGGARGTRPAWASLLPARLQAAGYRSYHSGKWHIDGDPRAEGFARSLDVSSRGQSNYFDPTGVMVEGRPLPADTEGFYATDAIGDHAVACLAEHARDHAGTPFFHYVAFTAPHFPLQAPPEVIAKYRDRYLTGWDALRAARAERLARLGIVTTPLSAIERDLGPPYAFPEALAILGAGEVNRPHPWDDLTAEQREFQATKMAIHAAMVDVMDRQVGRILAQVEAQGALENTLILFLSDNGGSAEIMVRGEGHDPAAPLGSRQSYLCLGPGWSSCANAPFRRHKTWVHEGGIATPWIVHWPQGIAGRGELRRQPVHAIDLVPTVLEIAGVPEHEAQSAPPLQGRSFAVALAEPAAPPAHESLWWCHEGNRAVRVGDWKLVAARGAPWELYDLAADRCETNDLAAAQPDRVAALEREWERIAAECRGMAAAAEPSVPAPAPPKAAAAVKPPNVVIVFADDLGYGDLGCYGGTAAATPAIDSLATDGIRFTDFHVAQAVCSASRAALLTGCYPNRIGIAGALGPSSRHGLAAEETTLAELLRGRGYRTAAIGKWHLGHHPQFLPTRHGFDEYFGLPYSNDMWPHHPEAKPGTYPPLPLFDGEAIVDAEVTPEDQATLTARYAARAVDFIERASRAADGRPFFLYLAHSMPHVPLFAGTDFRGSSPGGLYGDVLAEIDASVAALLAALDRTGHADDTLVIVTSDNGPWLSYGNHAGSAGPLREGKGTSFEGGVRVPCVARLPGVIPPGSVCDVPAMTIDFVPTIAALTGDPLPTDRNGHVFVAGRRIDGRDVGGLFRGQPADEAAGPVYFFWYADNQLQAVREGNWKLFFPHTARTMAGQPPGRDGIPGRYRPLPVGRELYDLASDPGESQNVAAAHPEIVARLEALAESARADLGDSLANRKGSAVRPAGSFPESAGTRPATKPIRPLTGRRPNIIYVMTDDQGYGDVAAHGNAILQTPNLDRLRDQSVRLTEFHVSPTCAPTRAALLTGRHEFRSGVTHTIFERERLAPSAVTLPQLLRRTAGYTTGIFGKWHLGDEDEYQPGKRGFDRVFIHGGGGIGQSYPGSCGDAPGNTYFDPVIRSDGRFVRTKGYCTDVFFAAATDWIDRCRQAEKPFFCYVATNCPHSPYHCPPGSDEKYLGPLEAAGIKDPKKRGDIARFYAMIENIDANIGRLLATLDEWGLAEETLLVFSTDNGTAAGGPVFNDGMRGTKGSPYRGGTRVPAFWRWPGTLPAGVDVGTVTAHIDVFPTLSEIAGATIPPAVAARIEGRSLVPLLEDAEAEWPDRILVTHVGRWDRGRAAESGLLKCRVREGRWQLVNTKNQPAAWELYDLAADPGEKQDVAAAHPEVVARLGKAYASWWESVQGDLVNEDLDGPEENPFRVAFRKQFGPAAAAAKPLPPTLADVRYGDHPKQLLHFWKAPGATAESPAPLVFFIHGGGWQNGDRMSGLAAMLPVLLEAGISVTSVEYRFISEAMEQGIEPPVKAPLHDAARALQLVRSKAGEWHIDKARIAAAGGSAGACSSLWLAFHDDLADPTSDDPVARESTRLLTAAVIGAQTTLDPEQMKEWTPNSRYGGHAFGFMNRPQERDSQFAQFLESRGKILPWINAYSPYALVSADDPPVYLFYRSPPNLGQPEKDPTHTANFGVKLAERLAEAGVGCELVYPGAANVQHPSVEDSLIAVLRPAARAADAPAAAAAPLPAAPAKRPPNIVFFLCDDLGVGDVGALGGNDIQTPNIDALFARGTRLTWHWAGNAVCAPSRCVLMTGKHPGHAVVRSNREVQPEGQVPMPAGTVTLAEILRDAGYATGGFGKWGLGAPGSVSDPVACGFERFYGYNCQREAHTFYPGHLWSNRDKVPLDNPALSGESQVARGGTVPAEAAGDEAAYAKFTGKQYAADLIAAEQLAFIREHAAKPFFLYVPTTVPHLALQVPADEPSLAHYEKHFGGEEPYLGGRGYVPVRRPLSTYAAMVTRMDREVGRIVGLLAELGLADDTIFVFSSDNGATRPGSGGIDTGRLKSNASLRDWKGSPYEGGLRVPTAIVWPGKIPAGQTLAAPSGFEDWMPTLLDLAGLHDRIPAGGDGVSLAAALEGTAPPQANRFLYRELTEGKWQAVTDGRWKAVRRGAGPKNPEQAKPTELFDLAADPSETKNVAAEHQQIVRRLEALMDREHVPHPAWPLPFADAASRAAPQRPAASLPAATTAPSAAAAKPARRPNILFILADDQSPFDLKAYDPASRLETPVIDALAARGCVLDAAYHMGSFSGAVCTPSRHMIMTGRSVWHLPIGPGSGKQGSSASAFERRCPADIEDHVLAAVFNAAGYATMRTCKQGNSYEGANRRFTVRHDATKRAGTAEGGSGWHADRVLDFLAAREASGDAAPFLIYYGFSHPHDTRDGTPALLATYGATNHTDQSRAPPRDAKQPPLPANWLPRHPFDNTHLDVRDEVDVSGVWRRRDEATIRNEIGRQFACSENIDIQIGRVLDKLRATGELDNTWIIYTSDHGMAIGRHGLQGKQNLYEPTWRVPLIVAGPGVKPGSRAPGNVYLADVLATLCEIAGIEPPATNEGTSFLPVLTGEKPAIREVLYGAYSGGAKPGIRSVRQGDWKLIKYESPAGGLVTQLFNLRENPAEFFTEHHDPAVTAISHAAPAPHQKNLAADPAHAEKRRQLEALLLAEMQRLHDPYRFSDQPHEEAVR